MDDAPRKGRWYDKDPALSRALESLKLAPDKYQAQIALNIIKVIVEHRIDDAAGGVVSPDEVESLIEQASTEEQRTRSRRWYDVNETLRSAIALLRDTPEDIQAQIVPTVARMIETALAQDV